MLVSHSRRLLFYHVPKAAGTTVHRDLQRKIPDAQSYWGRQEPAHWGHQGPVDFAHLGVTQSRALLTDEQFREYLKVCVVRNPLTRLYSAFRDRLAHLSLAPYTSTTYASTRKRLATKQMSFNVFIRDVLANVELMEDIEFIHFRPMHTFTHEDGSCRIDTILRFENFFSDYRTFLREQGLSQDYASYNLRSARFRLARRRKEAVLASDAQNAPVVTRWYEFETTPRLTEVELGRIGCPPLSPGALAVVERLYDADFKYFGYDLRAGPASAGSHLVSATREQHKAV
ncbi:MAG: sulfotransferase family 2 domain-containing protein [Bdellovibrionales bacterium]|nr:sulfotransferase family 2 domain-containing protein [Bdellovibrionales bacterium]